MQTKVINLTHKYITQECSRIFGEWL